jgi:hypothetical protein
MLNDTNQTETNLSLWKYFTDDAAKIKDRLWTMASWMFTLQAGITAFIAKHLKGESWESLLMENKVMILVTCIAAIAFSCYSIFMINQYGYHIRSMWNRADLVRRQMPHVNEIWFLNNRTAIDKDQTEAGIENKSMPKVATRLVYMCYGFIAVFLFLLYIAVK